MGEHQAVMVPVDKAAVERIAERNGLSMVVLFGSLARGRGTGREFITRITAFVAAP